MASQKKASHRVGREADKGLSNREQAIGTIELDATFGRMIGLVEGQQVSHFQNAIFLQT